MSEDLLAANLNRGTPSNLEPCPADPGLQAEVLEAIAALRSPTKQYVKSKHVADEIDRDATTIQVGQQLSHLADREDPPIEEWCPGNGSRTWRILLEADSQ